MTDQQLIHDIKQGHEAAFKWLVEANKDRLYNTILGFIQNQTEAEDVLQDVFIKVYENIGTFKGESLLSTWMYRIAVTQSLDTIRRSKRKKRAGEIMSWFGKEAAIENQAVEATHPGVLAENKEQSVHLFRTMQQLPDNQRTAFVLQKIQGMNQQEISEVMKLSIGAIESLLSRAKQNLRKTLSTFYHEK